MSNEECEPVLTEAIDGCLRGFLGSNSVVGGYIFPSKSQSALRDASKPSHTQLVRGFRDVTVKSRLEVWLKGKSPFDGIDFSPSRLEIAYGTLKISAGLKTFDKPETQTWASDAIMMSGNIDTLIEEQGKDVPAKFRMIHPAAQEVRGLCKKSVEFGLGETSLRSRFHGIIHFHSQIFVNSLWFFSKLPHI